MRAYRCPTCKKILTKAEYEKALRIHGEREAHLSHREEELKRKEHEQRARERDFKRGAKKKLQQETARVREQERLRAKRQQTGLKDTIQKLQERLRQRARGSTPQTEGLEFEDKLAARLEKEFPDDEILHKGKGGDVLHTVKFNKKPVGVIIYECKRTPSIQESHIVQTHKAKQIREADFAVLVTTGKKRGFSGFAQIRSVSIVSPLAVIPLASLLREHLIEMGRLKITKEKRAVLAQQLMRYIDSPQFRNPLEEVVQRTSKLWEMIKEEAQDHWHIWEERWGHYETIRWNTSQIQSNLRLVLHGEQPRQIPRLKVSPLQLPAPRRS